MLALSKHTRATPLDPTQWLQSLGLERYAAAFRENEVDETVLLRLTAEDLKDIGVGAVAIAANSSTPSPHCELMPKARCPPRFLPDQAASAAK